MTLKKDALLAMSMAGVVLVMAGISTRLGAAPQREPTLGDVAQRHDSYLLQTYIDSLNAQAYLPPEEADKHMAEARTTVLAMRNENRLRDPIDLFRAASILSSSSNPKELALAHEYALKALARGVRQARKIALESEDRILLSMGKDQRYGTQKYWAGTPLENYATPTPEIRPELQRELGLQGSYRDPVNR